MPPSSEPRRIISLVPAVTEVLFVLDAWTHVVGVSHACDFPPAVAGLPRVTRPRIDPTLAAGAFDAQRRALVRDGQSLFAIDRGLIETLKPDLVVAQSHCQMFAVTPKDLEALQASLKPRPEVDAFGARTYEEVLSEIRRFGEVVHRREEARHELFKQWRLVKEIRSRTQGFAKPRVAVLDWLDPPMFAGNWTQELVSIAGGDYALVPEGQPSRWGSWDELEDYEPDVIVAAPAGRDRPTAQAEFVEAIRAHHLGDLAAVEAGRAFVADGNRYFNRPGPRLIYSAALLTRALHWNAVPELPPLLEEGLQRLTAAPGA